MMKHLRGQILGFGAISHPPHHVGIHPLEVVFVKLGETRRVFLRLLYQKPLVRFFPQSLQRILQAELTYTGITAGKQEKLGLKKSRRSADLADSTSPRWLSSPSLKPLPDRAWSCPASRSAPPPPHRGTGLLCGKDPA